MCFYISKLILNIFYNSSYYGIVIYVNKINNQLYITLNLNNLKNQNHVKFINLHGLLT